MLGVVNDVPLPNDTPPVAAAYQLIVPALAVAPNVTVPVPQRLAGVLAVMVGLVTMVTKIESTCVPPHVPPVTVHLAQPVVLIHLVLTVPPPFQAYEE